MSASVQPPSSRVEENGSLVLRFGALIGLAGAAAVVCTLPGMMRVSAVLGGSAPVVRSWAALIAAALGPMAATIVALRGAAQGLRAFGESAERLRMFGLGLWLASLFATLALVGSVLRATTHHHALAGVTYACCALVLAVAWGLVCARLVAILRAASQRLRRAAVAVLGSAMGIAMAYLGVRFVSIVSRDPSSTGAGATVVDIIAFAMTAAVASRSWPAAQRPFAIVGPPIAVFLAALGFTTLRDPPVRQALGEQAPVFAPAADWISGR
jgi:hypothetical protein